MSKANQQQQRAIDLIQDGRSIFLTGEAGTGKTWTLNEALKGVNEDSLARLAPTGAAATLIGGSTIHRFFGLGVELLNPATHKTTKVVSDRIKAAKTIIIDEASMGRIDVITAIEKSCRLSDSKRRPWGGKQMIFVGDFAQLPPVITSRDEEALKALFGTRRYAFESEAWTSMHMEVVMLTQPMRQADDSFLAALNSMRWKDERLSTSLGLINTRVKPIKEDEKITILTTTNKDAEEINQQKLAKLPTREKSYYAKVEGDVKESDMPLPVELRIKVDAVVILTANTDDFFNGSRGIVKSMGQTSIEVTLDDGKVVSVTPKEWTINKYDVDENGVLKKIKVGTFEHFPMRLGFAITVHRSQGITLDRVHIKGSRWFTHGQAYVAFSRVRSLGGLSMDRRLQSNDIIVDPIVKDFMQKVAYLSESSLTFSPEIEKNDTQSMF